MHTILLTTPRGTTMTQQIKKQKKSTHTTPHTQAYADEVKERWGNTATYKENEAKTAGYSKEQWDSILAGMNDIFAAFAECKNSGEGAGSDAAQGLVKELKDYITEHFYHCTKEILKGLGQMYVCDERFKANIDVHGAGTTEFVSEAIRIY